MNKIQKNIDIIIFFIIFLLIILIYSYIPKHTNKNTVLFNKNYKSPEVSTLTHWINSDEIPSIESLRGKVVLIDFWTYSCINCIRSLPSIQDLHEKYADDGLVVIGVHSPEFAFERIPKNVFDAAKRYGLTYPIAQDNDFKTWINFKNKYWPAKYIVDKKGYVRYTHFGEGAYKKTEDVIVKLLDIEKKGKIIKKIQKEIYEKSPEIYLGLNRRKNFVGKNSEKILEKNQWKISGKWKEDGEKIFSNNIEEGIFLEIKTLGKEANLVMGGDAEVEIFIDDNFFKKIKIKKNDLYNIFDFKKDNNTKNTYNVKLKFYGKNIELFAWTFG